MGVALRALSQMERFESTLSWIAFGLLATVVLVSPWCFGAWEAWWFWPFTAVIFLSTALLGMQLLLEATQHEKHSVPGVRTGSSRRRRRSRNSGSRSRWHVVAILSYLLFLGYAVMRMIQSPVFTDAQRSVLLFMTPLLVALQVAFGLDGVQRRLLFRLILLNLLLLGLYGIINHAACGSHYVLGRPGYPQYYMDGRASGSYFCPDHYAGILEIALCLALGVVCARGTRWGMRVAASLVIAVALLGILLSKSRGAGLTVLVIMVGVWVWGLRPYSPRLRWAIRGALPLAVVALVMGATVVGSGYFKRFGTWFGWKQAKTQPLPEAVRTVGHFVRHSSRWPMLSGAMRAWVEAPVQGIGPGMHQVVWPHVAASGDGDVEERLWPTRLNNTNYSYEVHNDWAQLLEEYGLIGFALFMVSVIFFSGSLLRGMRRSVAAILSKNGSSASGSHASAMALGAWLALLAMAFHSLGDFNLQMPATNWLFGAVMALGFKGRISRSLVRSSRGTAEPAPA